MTASTAMLKQSLLYPHRASSKRCCHCAKLQALEPSTMLPTRVQASATTAGRAVPGVAISGMQSLIMRMKCLRGRRTPLAVLQASRHGSDGSFCSQQAQVLTGALPYEYSFNNNIKEAPAKAASGYLGVYQHHTGKYQAQIRWQGQARYLGIFEKPVLAAQAYDKTQLKLEKEYEGYQARSLNFPRAQYSAEDFAAQRLPWLDSKPRQQHSSSYMGVTLDVDARNWQAYCYLPSNRKVHCSRYSSEEDAAKARDKGLLRLFRQGYIPKLPDLHFPQSSYSEQDILSAYIPALDRRYSSKYNHVHLKRGKWVVQLQRHYEGRWLGIYATEREAAAVADLAIIQEIAQGRLKQVPKLNFSLTHYWRMLAEPNTFPDCKRLDMELIQDYLEALLWAALSHNEQA